MRTMPVAVARLHDRDLRASEARALSAVTPAHPVCLDACVVYCDIAAALINGLPVDEAIDGALARADLADGVRTAVEEARASDRLVFGDLSGAHGGFVLWSLGVAIRALLTAPDVEEGLVAVVMLGDALTPTGQSRAGSSVHVTGSGRSRRVGSSAPAR